VKENDEENSAACDWPVVYRQRQQGADGAYQITYGKMTLAQWNAISDVSDEYSTGNHLTTRQDIQIHFVSSIVLLKCGVN
jgi:sulfite reductase beta subunit-like hemoprotein